MSSTRWLGLLGVAAGAAALGALAPRNAARSAHEPARKSPYRTPAVPAVASHIKAAHGFNHASSWLAVSVLADSAMEHYRANFDNRAMFAPPFVAGLTLAAGLHGRTDHRQASHDIRHTIFLSAALTGLAGTAFHAWNIGKRPGGFSTQNLMRAAPIGAPIALLLAGALGATSELLRDEPAHDPRLFGMPAGKALALLASAGLIGTFGEAALLHFRGAYQHKAMYAPVTIPPLAATLLAGAALSASRPHWLARFGMRMTAALGWIGVCFHARGIARRQGGWRNWTQNLFAGPPLPAPPSFSALAIAGLAAIDLLESEIPQERSHVARHPLSRL